MEITLERKVFTQQSTYGDMWVGNNYLGEVVEPVSIEKAKPGEQCAIEEGSYELKIVNNPKSGTPTIKIYGRDIPHNISIRSKQPISPLNASPSFCNSYENERYSIRSWSILLSLLLSKKEHHTLTIRRK